MKKCCLSALFIFSTITLFSQKNTFSAVYTPAITKLNTNYLSKNMGLDLFYYLYTTRKPNKPMYGYNIGFTYERKINNKLSIASGLFYTQLKQHTGNFYGDKDFDKPPVNYLASELVFKYTGYELPVSVFYAITRSKKWQTRLELGTSINVIDYYEAKDYVIVLKTGKELGCCTSFLYSGNNFSGLKYKLSNGQFCRLGFYAGYEFNFSFNSNFHFSLTPLLKYYSNALKDKSASGTLDADAYFMGLQSKINFKF